MKAALKEIFNSRLKYNSATGVDRIRPEKFESEIENELNDIEKRYNSKDYRFRPYKELLILKSRFKNPRMVSIPTVRDKLVLSWVLGEVAPILEVKNDFIYDVTASISRELRAGKHFFAKLDITGFYDNINHELLISDLATTVTDDLVLDLLIKSIKNPTTPINSRPTDINSKGVPQGIPVSNMLAGFFAKRIDSEFLGHSEVYYVRYVDDILLLCNSEKKLNGVLAQLKDKIRSCGLEVNDEKESIGHVKDGLEFLGYTFKGTTAINVGVRNSSYKKHYLALLKIFSTFKTMRKKGKGNINRFVWDLNLKITGAMLNKDRYGWLFFFSQIDEDSKQLYALDRFVDQQLKKLGLNRTDLKIKRYSRAFKEIRKNLSKTEYIPNFDHYEIKEKKSFLLNIVGVTDKELNLMSDEDIDYQFKRQVYREIKSLEEDIGSTS